ncbi:MAG: YeeE/YedE family protein [Deltaproteobacteria bacterium]|nr:YeeE/YedE family protein [Deltaproteobacteria bacterium]
MAEPNLIGGLIGGAIIGVAASLLLLMNGRIAGVSGILGGIFGPIGGTERHWRVTFVAGLVFSAAIYSLAAGGLSLALQASIPVTIIAGLLVGFGTRLGSGCTSGHGVCGLARRSPRSLAATVTFMLFGVLAVFVVHHLSF